MDLFIYGWLGTLIYLSCPLSFVFLSHIRIQPAMATNESCAHTSLLVEVSPHAEQAGFRRPDWKQRLAATTPSGRFPAQNGVTGSKAKRELSFTFPGPLVVPDDDLALDSSEPHQSLRSCVMAKTRNKVTEERKTLYMAEIPLLSNDVSVMASWTQPAVTTEESSPSVKPPKANDVREYLEAFYHGLPVKEFPKPLKFTSWGKHQKETSPAFVGLQSGSSCTRIRTRPCPDGVFARQLNLNDIIDAAIEMLPDDAYALLILVDHDLHEDDDDDFCCGRAYGNSRVCVVSSARYSPVLHSMYDIDRNHIWPASHCDSYVASLCGTQPPPASRQDGTSTPLHEAVAAFSQIQAADTPPDLHGLWLCCLARTASHELGHCLGIGHCAYYACVMQGTAGMAEDCRQPPYLCPACLKKVARAVAEAAAPNDFDEEGYVVDMYTAVAEYCDSWKHVGMFAGYKAWLDARVRGLRDHGVNSI